MNTIEAKVIILTSYVKPDETMAINKFQRSKLTLDLSAWPKWPPCPYMVKQNMFK